MIAALALVGIAVLFRANRGVPDPNGEEQLKRHMRYALRRPPLEINPDRHRPPPPSPQPAPQPPIYELPGVSVTAEPSPAIVPSVEPEALSNPELPAPHEPEFAHPLPKPDPARAPVTEPGPLPNPGS